jgi:hypothetical protein
MDPSGAIHRRPLLTEGSDEVVGHARPHSPFAAEAIEASHVVVAYLADRRTSEGWVSEAYVVLDGGPPQRISDEGSGSTDVALAARGSSVLALLLDGRVAMTPVHGRTLSFEHGALAVSEDAVVFVGGGAETHTRAALGVSAEGRAFGLIPIGGENGFGVVSVRLDDPPRMDEPATWSAYPNGLDPAPLAATRGLTPVRVARVRPLDARPDAPRGLEIGRVDDGGGFVPYGLVATRGRVKHVSVASDRAGAMWVLFTDGSGTWLERRNCP